MRKKPLTQDARLLSQLDRPQKEAEMLKARRWCSNQFRPENAADYLKIDRAHETNERRWLRQVVTYWGMTASFVLDGTLSEKALLNPKFSSEMFTVFAKVHAFLNDLRSSTDNPDFMANMEKVISRSPTARKRLQLELDRQATLRKTHK
jgi:hypothetical protein